LTPLATDLRTAPGEKVYAQLPVSVEMFIPGEDGSYIHKGGIPVSPLGAVLRAGMAVRNSHHKRQAARLAREEWREVDRGAAYISNQRLALRLSRMWDVIDYRMLMDVVFDGAGLQLQLNGRESLRLVIPAPDYHFVMAYYLVFGQPVLPPEPYR